MLCHARGPFSVGRPFFVAITAGNLQSCSLRSSERDLLNFDQCFDLRLELVLPL